MKQIELAQKMGVSEPTISSWINDNRCPDYQQIAKMEQLLSLPMGYLIHDTPPLDNASLIDIRYAHVPILGHEELLLWKMGSSVLNKLGGKMMIMIEEGKNLADFASYKMPDDSMKSEGGLNLQKGDLVLLNRAESPYHGSLNLIKFQGNFFIRQYHSVDGLCGEYKATDPSYPPIPSSKADFVAKVSKIFHEIECP